MRKTAKMLLTRSKPRHRFEYEYYPENRFGDEHRYDARYEYPEDRYRDRTGREHYENGRYAPSSRYMPPYYSEPYPMYKGDEYMRPIGFRFDEANSRVNYPDMHGGAYVGDTIHGSDRMMGHAQYSQGDVKKMDHQTAEEWMRNLKNADGTSGAHWTIEQTTQEMKRRNHNCDPVEFWVAMNTLYSDFCAVNAKHGVNTMDYYVDAALAFWCNDSDAVQNKESAYYKYVVKH